MKKKHKKSLTTSADEKLLLQIQQLFIMRQENQHARVFSLSVDHFYQQCGLFWKILVHKEYLLSKLLKDLQPQMKAQENLPADFSTKERIFYICILFHLFLH
eukprot:TRINITY_DN7778_c1_g1_i7.p1 TRINITY_DN7778_c1_g1~~TRINITY_DN7778_c1_g1_i7.p1  ORF type:complete len:112 (-),score=10.28 TRINITY_DN7778_c1_g1_i7:50-355(-)